jgi:hypothetical protein
MPPASAGGAAVEVFLPMKVPPSMPPASAGGAAFRNDGSRAGGIGEERFAYRELCEIPNQNFLQNIA